MVIDLVRCTLRASESLARGQIASACGERRRVTGAALVRVGTTATCHGSGVARSSSGVATTGLDGTSPAAAGASAATGSTSDTPITPRTPALRLDAGARWR